MTGPAQRLQHDHRSPTRAGGAQSCAFYVDTVWETACIPTSACWRCEVCYRLPFNVVSPPLPSCDVYLTKERLKHGS